MTGSELPIADVTVIGGGLAGIAASTHLARAGMRVLCIDADPHDSQPVGESLDWSAPELLKTLGLPMERLIGEEVATYKRHVILRLSGGGDRHYIPSDWLGQPPFNIELRTLHVDRSLLNRALRRIALDHGVTLLDDKVIHVETQGRRITAVGTAKGAHIASPWFIDASGTAALLPRTFKLKGDEYGPGKVAMWSYFNVADWLEGTTLNADETRPAYMEWIWEIPIHPNILSVGYVAPADTVKAMRQEGLSVEDIFRTRLSRIPRYARLLQTGEKVTPLVTSWRCRVHRGITGPNWLIMGEAAAMVDPMTSNGVTAALRHAEEGASLILRARNRNRLPPLAAAMYRRRVEDLAKFFNCGIEKVIYDWPIRNRIGALNAGDVYTVPAWSLNHLYARFGPRGVVSTMMFGSLLGIFRAAASVYHGICRQDELSCEAGG